MGDESKKHVPISWWIYRDLEGTALGVTDEQPEIGTVTQDIGSTQGPTGWMVKVARPSLNHYEILKRSSRMDEHGNTHVSPLWEIAGTIHRITEAQYETYLEFEMFDEPKYQCEIS